MHVGNLDRKDAPTVSIEQEFKSFAMNYLHAFGAGGAHAPDVLEIQIVGTIT